MANITNNTKYPPAASVEGADTLVGLQGGRLKKFARSLFDAVYPRRANNLSDVADAAAARANLGAAPLASPAFTGSVTVPAPAAADAPARWESVGPSPVSLRAIGCTDSFPAGIPETNITTTAGLTDDRARVQAVLDAVAASGGEAEVIVDGRFVVGWTGAAAPADHDLRGLRVPSKVTIRGVNGGGLALRDGANVPLVRNMHQVAASVSGAGSGPTTGTIADRHIALRNLILHCNGLNQLHDVPAGAGTNCRRWVTGLEWIGVCYLTYSNVQIYKPASWTHLLTNWTHVRAANVKIDSAQASGVYYDGFGIHSNGTDLALTDLDVKANDDGLAIGTNLTTAYVGGNFHPLFRDGPVTGLRIRGVYGRGTNWNLVRLLSTAHRLDDVEIDGVGGSCINQVLLVDNFDEDPNATDYPGPGNFGVIRVRNVTAVSTAPNGYKNCQIYLGGKADSVTLVGVRFNGLPASQRAVRIPASADIRFLTLSDYESSETSPAVSYPQVWVEGTVGCLTFDRVRAANLARTGNTVELVDVDAPAAVGALEFNGMFADGYRHVARLRSAPGTFSARNTSHLPPDGVSAAFVADAVEIRGARTAGWNARTPVAAANGGSVVDHVSDGTGVQTYGVLLLDTFAGSDGAAVNGRVPDTTGGGAFEATGVTIQSNAATSAGTPGYALYDLGAGHDDVTVTVPFTGAQGANGQGYGVWVRASADGDGWMAWFDGTTQCVQIYEAVAGSYTVRGTPGPFTVAGSPAARVICDGATITVEANGSVVTSYGAADVKGTKVGLRWYNNTAAAGSVLVAE